MDTRGAKKWSSSRGPKKTMRRCSQRQKSEYWELPVARDASGHLQIGEMILGEERSVGKKKRWELFDRPIDEDSDVAFMTERQRWAYRPETSVVELANQVKIKPSRKGPRAYTRQVRTERKMPNRQLEGYSKVCVRKDTMNTTANMVRDGQETGLSVSVCGNSLKMSRRGRQAYNRAARAAKRRDEANGNFDAAFGSPSQRMQGRFW